MSTSPPASDLADHEVEAPGHDYRLRAGQYRRAIRAGIVDEADGVELRDGFLCWKPGTGHSDPRGHYRLSPEQYREMARLDILTTDDRIELLEGWLVAKMTKYPPHAISKGLTLDALRTILPPGWFVAIEDPVTAIDSEPEPDLSVVRGARRDYMAQAPGPQDVALVVEVADTSLRRDRSIKKRLYARSGFIIYWIVNLNASQVEVYTQPTGPTQKPDYLHRQDFGPTEMIPLVVDGHEIGRLAVRDLLP